MVGETVSLLLTRWTFAAPYPLALLQKNGRLVWCNAAAMRLLQDASPIVLRNGLLMTRKTTTTSAFRAWLKDLSGEPSFHIVRGAGVQGNVVLQGMTVMGAKDEVVGCRLRSASAPAEVADLTMALGVTPAQSGIVQRMILGSSLEQISEDTGLSITTVRTHLRNVYARLGISSRDELFRLCLPYVFLEGPERPRPAPAQPARKAWSQRFVRTPRGSR
ncbi:MAG: helix-turn-helix transcriptional regulator [Caulobacteraceae bacterium]